MHIEEITFSVRANVTAFCLEREDYWCRELCTYCPYGLNDNVRGIGSISKKPGLVVNKLFNRKDRKIKKRNGHRRRKKHCASELTSRLENCLREYKSRFSVIHICSLVVSLPVWMSLVLSIFECWRQDNEVPDYVAVLLKDLITFRKKRFTYI